jgi:hypothetical protein
VTWFHRQSKKYVWDTPEDEALWEFSKAFNEQPDYSYETGFSPYVEECRQYYLKLKNERLSCGGQSSNPAA